MNSYGDRTASPKTLRVNVVDDIGNSGVANLHPVTACHDRHTRHYSNDGANIIDRL